MNRFAGSSILEQIASAVRHEGIAALSVADYREYVERFPSLSHNDVPKFVQSAVVLVYPLIRGVLDSLSDKPNHLYFHHYRQANYALDRAAQAAARVIEKKGGLAIPIAASQTLDKQDLVAHVSHRHLAWLAGLGWHARNNLLFVPGLGTAVRIVSILTNISFPYPTPIRGNICAQCTNCMEVCPARAIGTEVSEFRLSLCFEKLTEFKKIPRIGQRICGLCQKVCPPMGVRSDASSMVLWLDEPNECPNLPSLERG